MEESKQKRKSPLTTIAIRQEYAQKLDEYLKGYALTRKDFVELSIDYFLRTGFDIRGEAFDLSPLEKITNRLEGSAKILESHSEGAEAIRQLLVAVKEQTSKQLPAPDLLAHAVEDKAKSDAKVLEQEKEILQMQSKIDQLSEDIKNLERWKQTASKELSRCKGIFTSADSRVLKELGLK